MKLIADTLVLKRGGRTIVDRLTLAVAGGRALILTGPNGAGKTTLIRAIAGFLPPASGTISLDGGAADRSVAEQAHYVGHLNGMKSSLTVAENLAFWAGYLQSTPLPTPAAPDAPDAPGAGPELDAAARVAAALADFDIETLRDIPAGLLSAGQKRRLGLARLLVSHRPLWLLDEPTVSLDSRSAGLLAAAVNRHTAAGGLAIAATHLALGLERADELQLVPHRVAA